MVYSSFKTKKGRKMAWKYPQLASQLNTSNYQKLFFFKFYAMAILATNKVVSTSTRPLEIFDTGDKYTVVGSTFNSNCLYSVKEWNPSETEI